MPITISNKRRAEILAAIRRTIADRHPRLISGQYDSKNELIRDIVNAIYVAVLAAAEGREQP